MSIDNTAHLILNRNEDENIESRVNGYYVHLRDLKAMANLWLTAQDVLPKLRKCWSQNADDAHFDSEAFELIGKLREALEKE